MQFYEGVPGETGGEEPLSPEATSHSDAQATAIALLCLMFAWPIEAANQSQRPSVRR